jgi:hypothetical protein
MNPTDYYTVTLWALYAREYDLLINAGGMQNRELLLKFILRFGRVVRAATSFCISDHVKCLCEITLEQLQRLAALTRRRIEEITELPPRNPSVLPT